MTIKKYSYSFVTFLGLVILFAVVIAWATAPVVPDFSAYPEGKERKTVFFSYFRTLIDEHNQSISNVRNRIQVWYENRDNLGWLAQTQVNKLALKYGIKKFDTTKDSHWQTLLRRVDIVPTSLALAQAAMESAWGTSRFARNAHNYFGQWCFTKDCGIVPIDRDPGANHEVKGFDSPEDAVASYVHNLNSHYAYKSFRDIRARLRVEGKPVTGMELASGLTRYSARGEEYIQEVRALMKENKLVKYDLDNTGE